MSVTDAWRPKQGIKTTGTFRSVDLGMVDVRRGAPPGRSLELESGGETSRCQARSL